MKLQIMYDSETSGSFGNAQRVQSEVNQSITDGSISNSVSSSLEQGNSNEFKVFLEGCCIWKNNINRIFPTEDEITHNVYARVTILDEFFGSCKS